MRERGGEEGERDRGTRTRTCSRAKHAAGVDKAVLILLV